MIWCALDNTLIWTWTPLITSPLMSTVFGLPMDVAPPAGPSRRRLKRVAVPGLGVGHACARKNVRLFLAALRKLAEVRMLTASQRKYAEAMNDAFVLGFTVDQIVARENLVAHREGGIDPHGILVDSATDHLADDRKQHDRQRTKLGYLGPYAAVVEVPAFRGEAADSFGSNWRDHVAEVERRMQNPTPTRVSVRISQTTNDRSYEA